MILKSKFIGAVEIGTSKITVLIGELASGRSLHIVGFGQFPSRGIVKGSVVDFKAASEATHRALMKAEERANARIDEVYLAQSGSHIAGFCNDAMTNVSAANNVVSQADIDTVNELAMGKSLPKGRTMISHLLWPYRLDDGLVPVPLNLTGRSLRAACWIIHGDERRVADHLHVIRGFNLNVSELVLSGIASGALLTTPEDRQNGALVIDIGAGTTDYALYRNGAAQIAGVLPVGGAHLTNDLVLGLRLTEEQADKMKRLHGRAVVGTKDRTKKIWLKGDMSIGDRQLSQQTIEQITSARVVEIFEIVRKKLDPYYSPDWVAAGVFLTGGVSKLPAIDEAASRVFGVQARIATPPDWVSQDLQDPGYSTALGLLHYGLSAQADQSFPRRNSMKGFFGKLFS